MLECSPLLSLHSIPEVKSRQMPNQQKNFADKNPLCINTYTILSLSPGLSSTHHLQEEDSSRTSYCKQRMLLRPGDKWSFVLLVTNTVEALQYCNKRTSSTAFFWVFREVRDSVLFCISWITVETCIFWLSTENRYTLGMANTLLHINQLLQSSWRFSSFVLVWSRSAWVSEYAISLFITLLEPARGESVHMHGGKRLHENNIHLDTYLFLIKWNIWH